MAVEQQRREGERLAGRPVDAHAGLDRLAAGIEEALDGAVHVEALGHRGDLVADVLERLDRDAGIAAPRIVVIARRLDVGPAAVEPIGAVGPVALAGLELDIEPRPPVRLHLLDLAVGDDAVGDELLAVDLDRGRMGGDRLVHQGLGEGGLVALVVAVPPVAEHVDDDRLLELLPELGRHLGGEHHRFRIVAVDVEDRRLDHLGDVGGKRRGARVARIGGEADLVVDDEMHRAAGAVSAQTRQPEAFGDHALARKGGVARDQERHHHGAVVGRGAVLVLLGAHLAEHHRIDDLEVRRIGGERQMHPVAVELAVGGGAEVILDVARALDLVGGRGAALELVEDGAVRLAHHLRQHAEAAAMRHAERDVLHAERAAALDDLLERGDHRFAAVEAEALGAGELEIAELLEALGLDQLVEDGALALAGEADLLVGALDALLHPALLRGVGDVHELDAQGLAIGALQDGDDLADGAEFETEHAVEKNRPVVVGFVEAVGARIELGAILRGLEPERIEIGVEGAANPIGADQHQGMDRIAGGLLNLGGGDFDAAALRLGLELVADRALDLAPVAGERRDEVVARQLRPVRQRP